MSKTIKTNEWQSHFSLWIFIVCYLLLISVQNIIDFFLSRYVILCWQRQSKATITKRRINDKSILSNRKVSIWTKTTWKHRKNAENSAKLGKRWNEVMLFSYRNMLKRTKRRRNRNETKRKSKMKNPLTRVIIYFLHFVFGETNAFRMFSFTKIRMNFLFATLSLAKFSQIQQRCGKNFIFLI